MNYTKKYRKGGWYGDSHRHKLARLGIKTGKKTRKKRTDIITESFRKGGKVLRTDVGIGKKGEVEKIYGELLVPTGPLIGYTKKKKINYAIKIVNGQKLKGDIMIDLNTIKKNHPSEFKIISNESYDKLRRTGVKLKPNEDVDGDGVINIKDARPLNKKDFRDNSTLQKIADWVNNN